MTTVRFGGGSRRGSISTPQGENQNHRFVGTRSGVVTTV